MPEHPSCLFCDFATGASPVPKAYEDDLVFAVDIPEGHPLNRGPVHFMVIPHRHIPNALGLTPGDSELAVRLFTVAADLACQKGVAESGFRLLTNTGPDANQTVMHFHLHCIGGRYLGSEAALPPQE
jgi:histidine triad (HIT) family protein